ncbi:MAG: hypothetical protein K2H16_00445 [Prevotella sp.]|nr:hypothetical protein [Prevotella sp.]
MNRFFHFILSFLIAVTAMATDRPKFDKKAYEKEQHQFVVREAKLTKEEAKTFFAIYDEMRAKERQLFKQMHKHKKQRPTTEEECRKAIIEGDKLDIVRKQLQQKYHLRMLKVLPASKVMEALRQSEKFDQMKFRQMSRSHRHPRKSANRDTQKSRTKNQVQER